MTRTACLLLALALSTSACAAMSKGGARGPVIQKSDDTAQPSPQTDSTTTALDGRAELGQR